MSRVEIENISSDLEVKLSPLKKLAQKVLSDFGEKGGLNIILVPDSFMLRLNQRYTRRKGTTDVLSFNFSEGGVTRGEKRFLGEVYISVERARRQSRDYEVSFEQELKRLLTHGILHLLGFNHQNKKDEKRMREKEEGYILS